MKILFIINYYTIELYKMSESLNTIETKNKHKNGYVYFVIPPELIDTNRIKIGMSNSNNENRIKSYGKDTITVVKYICNNPKEIEKRLIEIFKKNFKLIKGNEYFEGDIQQMKQKFIQILNNYEEENCQEENCEEENCQEENCEEENCEEENIIVTYEEWKPNFIDDIIITNKNNAIGVIKHKNGIWYPLHKNEYDKDGNIQETLEGYIKHCQQIFIKSNNDKIYKDIIDKCYKREINYYKFKNCEYCIRNCENNYVWDLSENSFKNCNNIETGIVMNKNFGFFIFNINNLNSINTKIVDDILKSLVVDITKIKEYKTFMRNLLLGENNYINKFNDYNENILTIWTKDVLDSLKKKYNHKNIITCNKKLNLKFYDTKNFENFIENKEKIIIEIIKNQSYEKKTIKNYMLLNNIDSIFSDTDLLKFNFINWCIE